MKQKELNELAEKEVKLLTGVEDEDSQLCFKEGFLNCLKLVEDAYRTKYQDEFFNFMDELLENELDVFG
jgi:hypothetical protein